MGRTVKTPPGHRVPPTTVYELKDVAEILQMPKSKVKNWTIGRPLRIVPSLSGFGGKGSRNIYSVSDLMSFALAQHLEESGFAPDFIQGALNTEAGEIAGIHAVIFARKRRGARVEMLCCEFPGRMEGTGKGCPVVYRMEEWLESSARDPAQIVGKPLGKWAEAEGLVGYYVVHIDRLWQQVMNRAFRLWRRKEKQ